MSSQRWQHVGTRERPAWPQKSRSGSGRRGAANGRGWGGLCRDGPTEIPTTVTNGARGRAGERWGD
jgi:hypothetical protein